MSETELREALRHIRNQIVGRHPGYAGDHRVWTVQFNEASIERIDAALAAIPAEPEQADEVAGLDWNRIFDAFIRASAGPVTASLGQVKAEYARLTPARDDTSATSDREGVQT